MYTEMRVAKNLIVYALLLMMMINSLAISVQAIPTYTVRLINSLSSGSSSSEGRLEIYYGGIWGTVCDDAFTNASARVACANLGYGFIGAFIGNRHGRGTGTIWLDDVTCRGAESGIENCQHMPWGSHNCNHDEDVSIRCGNISDYAVRLVDELTGVPTPTEGRLEIYYSGIWGTVCDDSFTNASAQVACASLGFGRTGRFHGNRHINGTGRIWLDDVICRGDESGIELCQHRPWGIHNCVHDEDVSIFCGSSIRLFNSVAGDVNPMEGQLEIYYSRAWAAVCDDNFTDVAARVACASLGFGYTGKLIGDRYGTVKGQRALDDVICNGTERNIFQCAHRNWRFHYCNSERLVSIKCDNTEEYAVRLIKSQNPVANSMEGRLEIYFAGVWGSVCDDGFTNLTAQVVCASLGDGYEGTFIGQSHYGVGTGKIWLDDVICAGGEPSIDKCTHRPWGLHNCNHGEDVGIKCENYSITSLPTVSTGTHTISVRTNDVALSSNLPTMAHSTSVSLTVMSAMSSSNSEVSTSIGLSASESELLPIATETPTTSIGEAIGPYTPASNASFISESTPFMSTAESSEVQSKSVATTSNASLISESAPIMSTSESSEISSNFVTAPVNASLILSESTSIMSTSTVRFNDATSEFTWSSKIFRSTSRASATTITTTMPTKTPSTMTTSMPTKSPTTITTSMPSKSPSTSLLLMSTFASTISSSESKLLPIFTKPPTTSADVVKVSSTTPSKAFLITESTPIKSTWESSETKSTSVTTSFNDATSEKPSATLTLSSSDLSGNSTKSSNGEQAKHVASANPGNGSVRIIGIVCALVMAIVFLLVVVILRRRYSHAAFWCMIGEDSTRNVDLIPLTGPSFVHNSESFELDSEPGFTSYGDCVTNNGAFFEHHSEPGSTFYGDCVTNNCVSFEHDCDQVPLFTIIV